MYDDGKKPLDDSKEADESMDDQSDAELEQMSSEDIDDLPENYQALIDPFVVRREASLLTLIRRGFLKRVIVFFNEKKQC